MAGVETVNHPDHFQMGNGLEAINLISSLIHKLNSDEAFLFGEAQKHMCKAANEKDNIEDIKNAIWYMQCVLDIRQQNMKSQIDALNAKFKGGMS